jgi:hypothetical protein
VIGGWEDWRVFIVSLRLSDTILFPFFFEVALAGGVVGNEEEFLETAVLRIHAVITRHFCLLSCEWNRDCGAALSRGLEEGGVLGQINIFCFQHLR